MSSIFEDMILNEKLTQEEIDHIKAGQTRQERRDRERAARKQELKDAEAYDKQTNRSRLSNRLDKKYYNRPDKKDYSHETTAARKELERRDIKQKAITRGFEKKHESAILDIDFK